MADDRRDPVRQAVGSAGQRAEAGVARQLSELAREMQADVTREALLTHIVSAAVTDVPGAEYAGITLITGKQFTTAVASDELADRDRHQRPHRAGQGNPDRTVQDHRSRGIRPAGRLVPGCEPQTAGHRRAPGPHRRTAEAIQVTTTRPDLPSLSRLVRRGPGRARTPAGSNSGASPGTHSQGMSRMTSARSSRRSRLTARLPGRLDLS